MPQWHDKQAKSLTQINRVSSQIPKMESKGSAADALAANRGPQTMPNNQALYQEALLQLQHLIDAAAERGMAEPHAAALATADTRARPSVRTVHIVAVEEDGLLFFASLQSGKGQQLLENPRAGLCFFWPELQEQVIVEGTVLLQSAATSDSYWQRRAREAQLSAWVSRQGSPAPTKKDALHQQARQLEQTLGFATRCGMPSASSQNASSSGRQAGSACVSGCATAKAVTASGRDRASTLDWATVSTRSPHRLWARCSRTGYSPRRHPRR
uniref:pyridoxine/pyridoxamine 5'-phosphate oxidase n=1 Tax=Pseudomonas sp. EA_105y_Pfl2_R69 TaxID=3088683 RepID=UPI0030DC14EB